MSKKSYFKIAFIIAALSCVAVSSSHGGETKLISGSLNLGGGTFSPSSKVNIQVAVGPSGCDPSKATTCSGYAAKSKHGSGDRVLATNNSDPKIYYKTVSVATTLETVSYSESFTDTSAWTAM